MKTKTTQRFENSVTKLYHAFHEGTLSAWNSCGCAVGNILNNDNAWAKIRMPCTLGELSDEWEKEYAAIELIAQSGYSIPEILTVEKIFMNISCGGYDIQFEETKESQFNALCAVVEYLAELDNIPNPMDYKSLFETENDKPKRQLIEVFV